MFVPENSGCPDGGPDAVLTERPGPASGSAPALTGAMLVQYCAPTLAGLKTASLFSCSFSDEQEMRTAVRRWNRTLRDKGLRMLPLRRPEGPTLIYVYRVSRLARDLGQEETMQMLRDRGYPCGTPESCLADLSRRLGAQGDFPHEIGLFLGYPPEDVRGFIDNKACGCKCVGCWKVYGDAEKARRLFEAYRRCTQRYCDRYGAGCSIECLIVPD